MQQRHRELEWLDLNLSRPYPLADQATRTSIGDEIVLPNDLLTSLYVHTVPTTALSRTGYYLSRVGFADSRIYMELSYEDPDTQESELVATVLLDRDDFESHKFVRFTATDDWFGTEVYAQVGRWPDFTTIKAGSFTFGLADTAVASDCIRLSTRRLASLRVRSGAQTSPRVSGKIMLQADTNMEFVVTEVDEETARVRANAYAPRTRITGVTGEPLQTINNIGPAPNGNVNFVGLKCTEVSQQGAQVYLENTCGDPCCGCDEIDGMVDQLQHALNKTDQQEEDLRDIKDQLDDLQNQDQTATCGDGTGGDDLVPGTSQCDQLTAVYMWDAGTESWFVLHNCGEESYGSDADQFDCISDTPVDSGTFTGDLAWEPCRAQE